MTRRLSVIAGILTILVCLLAPGARAQTPPLAKPQYLPFADFASDDNASQTSAKQAYNDAVERYNKGLYEYHVTLGQHDQLVDQYSRGGTPAEIEKARAEAAALRAKLQTIGQDVKALAAAVDQARRRAAQVGVTLTR